MAYKDFPDTCYVKTLDTSEIADLGLYNPTDTIELAYIQLDMYIHGALGGSEQVRLNVYDSNNDTLLFSSNWSDLADIGTSGSWLGKVRFDFDRKHWYKNTDFRLKIETANYTRNADTFYLSFLYDWPLEINSTSGTRPLSGKVAIIGYK